MRLASIRELRYACYSFVLGIVCCVLIKPHGLIANSGISYYGTFRITILPYAVAILGSGWFFSRVAWTLQGPAVLLLRRSLYFFSWVIVGVFVTPYSFNSVFDWLHTILGAILFFCQLTLCALLVWSERRHHSRLLLLWLAELLAACLCAVYVLPPKGYLIESQIAFQLLFMLFLGCYLSRAYAVTHE